MMFWPEMKAGWLAPMRKNLRWRQTDVSFVFTLWFCNGYWGFGLILDNQRFNLCDIWPMPGLALNNKRQLYIVVNNDQFAFLSSGLFLLGEGLHLCTSRYKKIALYTSVFLHKQAIPRNKQPDKIYEILGNLFCGCWGNIFYKYLTGNFLPKIVLDTCYVDG